MLSSKQYKPKGIPDSLAVLRETYQPWRFSELPEDVLHKIRQNVHENGKEMKNMELFYDPDTNYFVFHDRTSDYMNGIAKNWGDKKPKKQLTLTGLKQRPKKQIQPAPVPAEKPKQVASVNATPATPVPAEKPKEVPVPAKPAPVPPEKVNKPMTETPKPTPPVVQPPKRTPLQIVSSSTINQAAKVVAQPAKTRAPLQVVTTDTINQAAKTRAPLQVVSSSTINQAAKTRAPLQVVTADTINQAACPKVPVQVATVGVGDSNVIANPAFAKRAGFKVISADSISIR